MKRIACFLCVAMVLPVAIHAAPAVQWNPKAGEWTVARGEAVAATATLTATKTVTNLRFWVGPKRFWVVPKLANFITVSPTTVSEMIAGESVEIEIFVAVPLRAKLGTYAGMIHVFSKGGRYVGRPFRVVVHVGERVDSDGGIVTSADGLAEVEFPPGAVEDPMIITIEPVDETPPPDLGVAVGSTYEMGPSPTIFARPITVSFQYDPATVPTGSGEPPVGLVVNSSDGWKVLGSTVDSARENVFAQINHFTRFAIVAPACPNPPQISVWPGYGIAGTRFDIVSCLFTPDGTVTSHLLRPNGTETSRTWVANSNGSFTEKIHSVGFSSGTYAYWAIDDTTGGASDTTHFTVTGGPPAPIPQTGQSTCFDGVGPIPCGGSGQDGEFQAGVPWPVPRFTDNGDGTVRDNLTGLIWLRDADCAETGVTGYPFLTWDETLLFSDTLFDGSVTHSGGDCGLSDGSQEGDWRLPNILELVSLQGAGDVPSLPIGHPFQNVQDGSYMSSTSFAAFPAFARRTGFAGGIGFSGGEKSRPDFRVWPVRGPVGSAPAPIPQTGQQGCYRVNGSSRPCGGSGQDGEFQAGVPWPSPRFVAHGDGTVWDRLTGSIWLRDADCFGTRVWTSSVSLPRDLAEPSCSLRDDSRVGDWRLPNVRELLSLIDFGSQSGSLPQNHPFSNVRDYYYWSSTFTPLGPTEGAHVLDAPFQTITGLHKGNALHVWPVRHPNN